MSESPDHAHVSQTSFFKWPSMLALLSVVAFAGAMLLGAGPCGSVTGMLCFFVSLLCGLATVITSATGCARVIANHRRAA